MVQQELDRITLRVIGGALNNIAERGRRTQRDDV